MSLHLTSLAGGLTFIWLLVYYGHFSSLSAECVTVVMATATPWRRSPVKVLWEVFLPPWPVRYHQFLHFYGCFWEDYGGSFFTWPLLMYSFLGIVLSKYSHRVMSMTQSHCLRKKEKREKPSSRDATCPVFPRVVLFFFNSSTTDITW